MKIILCSKTTFYINVYYTLRFRSHLCVYLLKFNDDSDTYFGCLHKSLLIIIKNLRTNNVSRDPSSYIHDMEKHSTLLLMFFSLWRTDDIPNVPYGTGIACLLGAHNMLYRRERTFNGFYNALPAMCRYPIRYTLLCWMLIMEKLSDSTFY